jgi:hypothetical protein
MRKGSRSQDGSLGHGRTGSAAPVVRGNDSQWFDIMSSTYGAEVPGVPGGSRGVPPPGGLLWNDPDAIAFHLPPTEASLHPYLGRCLVVTRRHTDLLGGLTEAEVTSIGSASRAIAQALRIESVHVAVIGIGVDRFHHISTRATQECREGRCGWMSMVCLMRRTAGPTKSRRSSSASGATSSRSHVACASVRE